MKYKIKKEQKERKMRRKEGMNLPMMILSTAVALGVMLWCSDLTVRAEAQQQIGNRTYSVSDGDGGVIVGEANFPDPVFCGYIDAKIDTDRSGTLSDTEINNVASINFGGVKIENGYIVKIDYGITNLSGIELFTNLNSLDISNNMSLTQMDLSNNQRLSSLVFSSTGLTSLDLSQNTSLTYLDSITSNQLPTLDLSHNTELTYFRLEGAAVLEGLDFSANTKLTRIETNARNVSGIENLTELRTLYLYGHVNGGNMLPIDLSKLTNLTRLNLGRDARPVFTGLEQCTSLQSITIGNMADGSSIDLNYFPSLTSLTLSSGNMPSLTGLENCNSLSAITVSTIGMNTFDTAKMGLDVNKISDWNNTKDEACFLQDLFVESCKSFL
jgi:hypothetical protein